MRIDIHAHYFPSEYLDLLQHLGSTAAGEARMMQAGAAPRELDARFELMDGTGIDVQVLSVSPQQPYVDREADAVAAARLGNDLVADLVHAHPRRFKAFGAVPLPHVDAAVMEINRCLDDLDMVGITVNSSILGASLADRAFEPLFAELNRRRTVLVVHPAGAGIGELTTMFGLTWVVGAPFEDTIAALHLIRSGLTTRFPHIRILVGHLGGTLPFLMQRIDALSRPSDAVPQRPSELARRLWYDTVSHGHLPALRCACETFGPTRLILGTDYPYVRGEAFRRAVTHVEQADLPPPDIHAILDQNAVDLPGRD